MQDMQAKNAMFCILEMFSWPIHPVSDGGASAADHSERAPSRRKHPSAEVKLYTLPWHTFLWCLWKISA